jgi:diguanylate cyclase (GGDEF)-like protein
VYLREAAPVIEAKRLMDTLRATNLTDAMTGLHNRRFLEEYAETLVSSSQRRKSQLAILMLDLDYFKMVNDTYGHDAGDSVLKALAKTLQSSVRSSDLVIRYGGEEFLIIMQDAKASDADRVAEKIRSAVEALKIQLSGTVLQKTISIGIADFPGDSETFWQAVKYADVAMYNAKESGRNRVVRFRPELWKDEVRY